MIRPLAGLPSPSSRAISLVITISALAVAALVAYSGSVRMTVLALALVVMIFGGLALLRWPGLGPVLLIPITFFVPFSIGTGSQTEINATLLWGVVLTLLWLVGMIADPNRRTLHLVRPQIALIALCVVFVVAMIVGQGHWLPLAGLAPIAAQIGGLAIVLVSAAVFFVAAEQLHDERWIKLLVGLFLILGAVFVIGILIDPLRPYLLRLYQSGSTSSQFCAWLTVLALSQAVFNRRLHPLLRGSLAALSVMSVYSIYTSVPGWISGWLPTLFGMAVILLLRSRWFFLLVAAGALLVGPQITEGILASDAYSYSSRLQAWMILTEIVRANPVVGLGPANYYWYTPLFAISGYYGIKFNSHNQYIDLIAQAGTLGLLAYLWFLVSMALFDWRVARQTPEGFTRGLTLGALGGLATMAVAGFFGDWVLPFVYNVGLVGFRSSYLGWLFLGTIVAVAHLQGRQR